MILKVFKINPVAKPRMTRSDRWKARRCVMEYWAFKSQIEWQRDGFEMPESNYHVIFYIPMPESWPQKKKEAMAGQPHRLKKLDKDNLEKALLDALCKQDGHIWDGRVTKRWDWEGRIEIYKIE